jgi:transcriptional regulator with XRE-family HTH domain
MGQHPISEMLKAVGLVNFYGGDRQSKPTRDRFLIHSPIDSLIEGAPAIETLGARLARLRRMQGLSKTEVADRLGISITAICHWEQDRSRPKAARLQSLSQLFGVSTADLLSDDGIAGRQNLADLVARTRAEIARVAGTNPSKVRIVIEM